MDGATVATILKFGELGLLGLVLVGGWKLARPAIQAWLMQYQRLIDHLLEMTKALSLISVQLEELHSDHKEIAEMLRRLNGRE